MPLTLKHDVDAIGLTTGMLLAIIVVEGAYKDAGHVCTITSLSDGKHSPSSRHYVGCAADFRTMDIPKEKLPPLRETIANRLGPRYDVVLEPDHLHVEWDPKKQIGVA